MKHFNSNVGRLLLALVLVVASAVLLAIPGMAAASPFLSLLGFGLGTTYASDLTDAGTPSDHKIRDVSMDLTWLRPSRYPLDTILRRADVKRGMKRAKQIKVEWEEDDTLPRADAVNGATGAGAAGASVAVTVDNGSYWRKDDLVYLPDNGTSPGGVLWVAGVSGNVITVYFVTPGGTSFGTVPALADNEVLKRMSNAKHEHANASDSRVTYPGTLYNYTQIFDAVVAVSGTKLATENYTEADMARSEKQSLYDLRQTAEYSSIFGDRALITDPTSGKQRSFMGGITYYLSSNDLTYTAGSLTEANLIDMMRQLFSGNAGSDIRYWFPTPNQTAEIDKVLASTSTLRGTRDEKQLGVRCKSITSSFGKVFLFNHQGLAEMGKTNWGLIIDPAHVRRRPLRPMKTKQIEDNDVDGKAEQWIEEVSQEVRYEATHAVVRDTATDSFS
jgi:hypothetical protein